MDEADLVSRYPRLYHMAHVENWPGIARFGLLSTSALLDRFVVGGAERAAIESNRRRNSVHIGHPQYGHALLRDQRPMSDTSVAESVTGCTPAEWYAFLNARVFFWLTVDRLAAMNKARAYRDNEHLVFKLDTRSLVAAYRDAILLSPINSGITLPFKHKRRRAMFQPIESFRPSRRGADAIVEFTVQCGVPDVLAHTLSVDVWVNGRETGPFAAFRALC